jgi:uncharacterized membrane protein YgaE (UPF0421/DUF939 family)
MGKSAAGDPTGTASAMFRLCISGEVLQKVYIIFGIRLLDILVGIAIGIILCFVWKKMAN